MKGKEAEKFAAGDLATRIPQSVNHSRRAFSMHHGENTVTAKSRASTRKAYIGGERGQGDTIYHLFNTHHQAPNSSSGPEGREIDPRICQSNSPRASFTCLP